MFLVGLMKLGFDLRSLLGVMFQVNSMLIANNCYFLVGKNPTTVSN